MIINNMTYDEKVYLKPGDRVKIKQNIPNSPIMIVHRIERNIIRDKDEHSSLKGCKCRWFTENGFLQEAVFSTKDLILVD